MTAARILLVSAIVVLSELMFVGYVIVHNKITQPTLLGLFGLACVGFVAACWWMPRVLRVTGPGTADRIMRMAEKA